MMFLQRSKPCLIFVEWCNITQKSCSKGWHFPTLCSTFQFVFISGTVADLLTRVSWLCFEIATKQWLVELNISFCFWSPCVAMYCMSCTKAMRANTAMAANHGALLNKRRRKTKQKSFESTLARSERDVGEKRAFLSSCENGSSLRTTVAFPLLRSWRAAVVHALLALPKRTKKSCLLHLTHHTWDKSASSETTSAKHSMPYVLPFTWLEQSGDFDDVGFIPGGIPNAMPDSTKARSQTKRDIAFETLMCAIATRKPCKNWQTDTILKWTKCKKEWLW